MFRSHGSGKWIGKDEAVLEDAARVSRTSETTSLVRPRMEVGEGLPALEVIRRAKSGFEHVIQRDSLEYNSEYRASMLMMNSPGSYFKDPIATIFSKPSDDLIVFQAKFEAPEKKHRLLKGLNDFVLSLPKSSGVLLPAISIADELYTNGSKNAWDRDQTPWEDEPRRSGEIEFFAAASETRLVLGCRDSFGLLKTEAFVERISLCLENGVAESILKHSWGAGIGAFYIFDAAKSVYVGVNPGVESVVCAALPLGIRQREAEDITKNLHFIDIGRLSR